MITISDKNINSYFVQYIKYALLIIIIFSGLQTNAQQYPVQLTAQLNTPIPLNLSLFNAGVNSKIHLTLTNRDLQGAPLKIKLKMIITGPGIQMITSAGANLNPIILENGLPTVLTSADLTPYFNLNNIDFSGVINKSQYQSTGQLPEGAYSYCFEVWDYNTNKLLSFPFCAYAYCTLSEPPLLNLPDNKSTVLFQDPTNIRFSWTPRHNDNPDLASIGVSYRFTLKELTDTSVAEQVSFNSGLIIYTDIVSQSNLVYGVTLPSYVNLTSNKKYAWNVEVISNDPSYQPSIRNGGRSEIYSFKYKKDCTPPQFKTAEALGRFADISWEQNRFVKDFVLKYCEKNSNTWQYKTISNGNTQSILDDISFGKVYKYNVGTVCDNSTEFGEEAYFTIPPPPSVSKTGVVLWGMQSSDSISTGATLIGENYSSNLRTGMQNPPTTNLKTIEGDPLDNVKVSIYRNLEPINIGYTNEAGTYTIDIDTATILNDRVANYKFKIELLGNTNSFKNTIVEFNLSGKQNGNDILKEIQEKTILFVRNFIYYPQINPASRQNIVAGSLGGKVNVYLPLTVWSDSYGRLNPRSNPKIVTYEGNSYVQIGTIDDQHRYLNIILSNAIHTVMANVVIKNQDALSKIVKPILGSYWSSAVLSTSNLSPNNDGKIFSPHVQFDPTVTFYGKIWRDPNKKEGMANGTIEFKNISYNTLASATADLNGNYSLTIISSLIDPFTFLYASRMDNRILKSTNSANFEYPDTLINHNSINNDMILPPLAGKIRFVYGKILDPNGLPFTTSGKVLYNNEEIGVISRGFYTVKIEDGFRIEDSLTFNVPDFQKNPVFDSVVNLSATNWLQGFNNRIGTNYNIAPLSYNNSTEELMGVTHANVTLPYGNQVILAPVYNNLPVNVKLKIKNLSTNREVTIYNRNTKKLFVFKGDQGAYQFEVQSDTSSPNFLPFTGRFTVNGESQHIVMKLSPATTISGVISEKNVVKKLDSTYVEFMGTEYSIMTDTLGRYTIKVPSREQRVHLKRRLYSGKDTVLKLDYSTQFLTLNFELPRHVNQNIRKISGYDVVIDKQKSPNYDSSYIVSGTLLLKSNDFYTLDSASKILHFTDAKVIANEQGLAFPIDDSLRFNELIIKAKAFGYAPIEIVKPILKQYSNLNPSLRRFSEGLIVGNVSLKLNTIKSSFPKFPFEFSDAGINYTAANNSNNITTFVSSGIDSSRVFPNNKKIFIHLIDSVNNVNASNSGSSASKIAFTGNYIERDLLKDYKIFIQKDSSVLSGEGISLAGHIKLPRFIFDPISGTSNETLKIHLKNTVILNRNLEFQDWTSESISSGESVVRLKRLYSRLSNVKITDIGTENAQVNFSGIMSFFKDDLNAPLKSWKIKEFFIKNSGNDLLGTLSVTPPVKKFWFNGLTFEQKLKNDVEFGFVKRDSSFNFVINGILSYDSAVFAKASGALNKIFPLEIETFQYGSKNGSMLLSAKPNTEFDFEAVKISLKKFAVNVGSNVTINDMLALVYDTVAANKNYNSVLNETPSSKWAMAFSGEAIFPNIKGYKATADATLAFGVFNNEFQFAVDQLGIKLEVPNFTLQGRLGLKLYGDTLGLKGSCRMDVLDKTTAIDVTYYKIKNKDTYFAGSVMVPVVPMLITYPVQWYSAGIGFEYKSKESEFYCGIAGQLGPVGTTKEEGYLDSAYIGIMFKSPTTCGLLPTIKGGGNFIIKDKKWGYATAEIDFCNLSTLLNVHLDVLNIVPKVNAKVDGVLYGVAPRINDVNGRGMFFFNVNANMSFDSLIYYNAQIAIGINYNNDKDFVPQIVKTAFATINDLVKADVGSSKKVGFNGLLLEDHLSLAEQSGSYSLGPFNAQYNVHAEAMRRIWYNYNAQNFGIYLAANGSASGSVGVETLGTLTGSAEFDASILGGYNGSKWYFNGKINTSIQITNRSSMGCNDIGFSYGRRCLNYSAPCVWEFWESCDYETCIRYINGVGFKACLNLGVNLDWIQGEDVKFEIKY